tara:strand:+ start:31 stop:738 length:708 start_codon:yes stop_codon:yes gene_type:complete
MLLSDLFMYLAYGELSQLAIGTNNHGGINESDYPTLITHINLGLTNLHSRLPLKQSQVIIMQQSDRVIYPLTSVYATNSDSTEKNKFILDSVTEPFVNDVLRVEEVYTENNILLPLNDSAKEESIFTPSFNTLQVLTPQANKVLAVLYRANHAHIPAKRGVDITNIEVNIPAVLIEPLLTFVVGRVAAAGNSAENMQKASAYQQKYEVQLQMISQSGGLSVESTSNLRMRSNGWV